MWLVRYSLFDVAVMGDSGSQCPLIRIHSTTRILIRVERVQPRTIIVALMAVCRLSDEP